MNKTKEEKDLSNSVGPFYPTLDGKPPKSVPQKPSKKGTNEAGDNKETKMKYPQPQFIPVGTGPGGFGLSGFGDNTNDPQGPGFFNPTLAKGQFDPYNPYSQNPNTIQDKPAQPDLYNIVGPNNPANVPPHVRIEHLLQHLQGNDQNPGPLLHLPPSAVAGIDKETSLSPSLGVQSPQTPAANYPFNGFPIHPISPEQGLQPRPETG